MLSPKNLKKYFSSSDIDIVQHKLDQKTKPLGSLGTLEDLARQMALIQQNEFNGSIIIKPTHVRYAGDHGIAMQHRVSIAPSSLTTGMINNFIAHGAAINAICKSNNIPLEIIDCGVAEPKFDSPICNKSVGHGTKDFSVEDAMTEEELAKALKNGSDTVENLYQKGITTLLLGEMGIGNTSSASAIFAKLYNLDVDTVVGRGTGINDEQLTLKKTLISQGLNRHQEDLKPSDILRCYGGFEIATMCGSMLKAAELNMIILVDGFVVTAAAAIAVASVPNSLKNMIYAHTSGEGAHKLILSKLGVNAVVNFGMRLGEGTGAAVVLPLLKSAASCYNDMAYFDGDGNIVQKSN